MQWCCAQWIDLGTELAEQKVLALDKLLKKGIPRSTFSTIYRTLEGIGNFCPFCGGKISTTPQGKIETNPPPVAKPVSKAAPTIKCPPCRGTGKVGEGLNCMTCLGEGVLDRSNPNRVSFDPVLAEELGEKLAKVDAQRSKVVKQEEVNPQRLREDATPEAVKNL